MELKLFLGQELIDSRRINALKLNSPGYISQLRIEMEEKNETIIDLSSEEPQFFLDRVPSQMNSLKKLFRN